MATIEAVAAGFTIKPSRAREREYVGFLIERDDQSLPLDGALYPIRQDESGEYVVLLPLRSWEAARRICKAFEQASKAHKKAAKARGGFDSIP